jgi:ATP-dependent Lon protease
MKENGVGEQHITFPDEGITQLIRDYTREAGVRNLEREIGTVCRKVARHVAADEATSLVTISPDRLGEFLGARKFLHGVAEEKDEIGVAQGLAWTEVGGETMPIEVSLVEGKGGTKLTGNLGNVMKESCEAAMTYARAHANELGISGDWTRKHDAHIHVPAGAVPKDGPSAGVAIAVAVISALTEKPVRKEIALSGEISLRGRVLTVGGVKEKVLAAHRAGLKEVVLPSENQRDLEDIPEEVRNALKFHWIENLDEALSIAIIDEKASSGRKRTGKPNAQDKQAKEKTGRRIAGRGARRVRSQVGSAV